VPTVTVTLWVQITHEIEKRWSKIAQKAKKGKIALDRKNTDGYNGVYGGSGQVRGVIVGTPWRAEDDSSALNACGGGFTSIFEAISRGTE